MYSGYKQIKKPIRTQVVIWTAFTQQIGGIETFIFNFAKAMNKYYDITVLYETIAPKQLARLQKIVQCIRNDKQTIICDTCIINRITDKLPGNVKANQTIQMVHACRMLPQWQIPQDKDHIVGVSQAALGSFGEDKGQVIYNLVDKPTNDKTLLLISATRLSKSSAFEKGHERMLKLADKLTEAHIPYIWLLFSDASFSEKRDNMVILPPTLDIAPYLAKADYYVSLSDAEGFGYSMVESLINGTPVITTPIAVLPEIGFKDKEHGYIVPFDMDFDIGILKKIPKVEYKRTNTKQIKQWRKLLGDTKPKHDYKPEQYTQLEVTAEYYDTQLSRKLQKGEVINVSEERAQLIVDAGYGRRI